MSASTAYVQVLSNDPRITYHGPWESYHLGEEPLKMGNVSGQSATLVFEGTQVVVQGVTLDNANRGAPVYSFSLDQGEPFQDIGPADSSEDENVYTSFASGTLPPGQHELVVMVEDTGPPFYLYEFLYEPSNPSTETAATWVTTSFSVSPTTGASSSTTSSVSTTSSSSSTSSSAPAATIDPHDEANNISGSASGPSASQIGAIAGGVIGGVFLLILSVLAFYLFYYKPRKSRPYAYHSTLLHDDDFDPDTEKDFAPFNKITPFIAPSLTSSSNPELTSTPLITSQDAVDAPHAPPVPERADSTTTITTGSRSAPLVVVNDMEASTSRAPDRKTPGGPVGVVPEEVQVHADSGLRFDAQGGPVASGSRTVVVDVPPLYTES